jgi:DNA-binding response OmpR family regulator
MNNVNGTADATPLDGVNILVVEDDYFIASEICNALRQCNAHIVGPAPDLSRGLQLLDDSTIHCAVLDINLHGEFVFDLANEALRRGVPVIFATGYDEGIIPELLVSNLRLEKPVDLRALVRAVSTATRRAPVSLLTH